MVKMMASKTPNLSLLVGVVVAASILSNDGVFGFAPPLHSLTSVKNTHDHDPATAPGVTRFHSTVRMMSASPITDPLMLSVPPPSGVASSWRGTGDRRDYPQNWARGNDYYNQNNQWGGRRSGEVLADEPLGASYRFQRGRRGYYGGGYGGTGYGTGLSEEAVLGRSSYDPYNGGRSGRQDWRQSGGVGWNDRGRYDSRYTNYNDNNTNRYGYGRSDDVRSTQDAINQGLWDGRVAGQHQRRTREEEDVLQQVRERSQARATPPEPYSARRQQQQVYQRNGSQTRSPLVTLQGSNSLRTWSIGSPDVRRVQVLMKTDGRPLEADIDLWHGPDNMPQMIRVYSEDGDARPFNCVLETPGAHHAVALKNIGPMEFPCEATVEADIVSDSEYHRMFNRDRDYTSNYNYNYNNYNGNNYNSNYNSNRNSPYSSSSAYSSPYSSPYSTPSSSMYGGGGRGDYHANSMMPDGTIARMVQGGAVYTFPFEPSVSSLQVLLKTDGRPLKARIELLQGPNTVKQMIDIYSEDGLARPFYAVLETPGVGNIVRIINAATMEFPLTASVEPYRIDPNKQYDTGYYMGGGSRPAFAMDQPWLGKEQRVWAY